jgi:hypothetical protein
MKGENFSVPIAPAHNFVTDKPIGNFDATLMCHNGVDAPFRLIATAYPDNVKSN